jgi:glucose-6-phosphate-specific signal transduction histidine kinase
LIKRVFRHLRPTTLIVVIIAVFAIAVTLRTTIWAEQGPFVSNLRLAIAIGLVLLPIGWLFDRYIRKELKG